MNEDLFSKAIDAMAPNQPEQQPPNNVVMMFKLSSGDTIIARIVGENEANPNQLVIEDPWQIRTVDAPIENGTRATTFYAEWFLSCETRFHMLAKDHIISSSIPNPAARAEYARLVARKNVVIAQTAPLQKPAETASVMGAPIGLKTDWSIAKVDPKNRMKLEP